MYECNIYKRGEGDPFADAEFLAIPRIGEQVFFMGRNEDEVHVYNLCGKVVGVRHVARCGIVPASIQITVVGLDRQEIKTKEQEQEHMDHGHSYQYSSRLPGSNSPVVM